MQYYALFVHNYKQTTIVLLNVYIDFKHVKDYNMCTTKKQVRHSYEKGYQKDRACILGRS